MSRSRESRPPSARGVPGSPSAAKGRGQRLACPGPESATRKPPRRMSTGRRRSARQSLGPLARRGTRVARNRRRRGMAHRRGDAVEASRPSVRRGDSPRSVLPVGHEEPGDPGQQRHLAKQCPVQLRLSHGRGELELEGKPQVRPVPPQLGAQPRHFLSQGAGAAPRVRYFLVHAQ